MAGDSPASGAMMHGVRDRHALEAGLSRPVGGVLLAVGVTALGLALWEVLAVAAVVPPLLLPRPSPIAAQARGVAPTLVVAAGQTLVTALAGVIVGSVIAAPACAAVAALAATRAAGAVLFAALWLRDLQAIIVLALIPAIAVLSGGAEGGVVAAATMGAALALLASVSAALALGRVLVRALRQAFALALLGTLVCESIYGKQGLDARTWEGMVVFDMGRLLPASIAVVVTAMLPLGALLVLDWAMSRPRF
ncbi:hypothetical protein FHP25_12035 [Vineibacter terrae]|uniref:Uncharacterized protein n=1 Tax=Vineibacter terrae TaxID=2586908 RepID=A0A5C8PNV2_9HYPH|nr:hypothetical protein [Vineibacter terrae]TXL76371.1 hypothetical protein FHP25_12035 [Vineibacter terrae]